MSHDDWVTVPVIVAAIIPGADDYLIRWDLSDDAILCPCGSSGSDWLDGGYLFANQDDAEICALNKY